MFKNKKAISQYLVIMGSWIAFIAITLFFFLLFSISLRGCGHGKALQELTGAAMENSTAKITFLNYLRTPVEFNKTIESMADLISFYAEKDFKDKEIEKTIRNITNQTLQDFEYCYRQPGKSVWFIKGACIYISKDSQERVPTSGKTPQKNRKFFTDNFAPEPTNIILDEVVKLPLKNSGFVYVHLYHSGIGAVGRRKCPRYST